MTLLYLQKCGKNGVNRGLPRDSVRRLTLRPGVRRSPVGQRLAALAIDRLFSPPVASVKGIRRFGADHFFGARSKMGRTFRLQLHRSLTKFMFARPLWHLACLCHVVGAMKYFGGHMAKMIEFYIPQSFRKDSKWFPPDERGKVLAFPQAARKSA